MPWQLSRERLEHRFPDKKPALAESEALNEANRCLYCYHAPCITACPTEIDIPSFIRKIGTGNVRGSARTILRSNLLGQSCAVVCPVEVLCESACVYNGHGQKPVEIGRLQRYAMEHGRAPDLLERREKTGKRVALVGGGPASLACGGALALLGHEAVLYEKESFGGGLNMTGVAPYKLRGEGCRSEVDFILALGVEMRTGVTVGKDITPEEMLSSYDAVFLGIGLGGDSLRGVLGAEGPGILGALEWIRAMKLEGEASVDGIRSAVVIGGGNTALDAVQELAGLGIPDVTLVYRRSEREMPGYKHEWEGAKKLRVKLLDRAVVHEVRRHPDESLASVVVKRAEEGESSLSAVGPHPHGFSLRDSPAARAALGLTTLVEISCDVVLLGTGQERLQELAESFPGVRCDARGRIIADPETLATGNDRVFTGGDCYNGGKEVVNAAAEGQRAARAIDRLLTGAE